jgi:dihydrofolate reductase
MRKLIAAMMTSLDGVVQAPGGPEEDPTGGFKFGGWVFPHWDEAGGRAWREPFARPFDLLLGRKTYEIFAAYWPYQEGEIADPFNATTKYVATSSVEPLTWRGSVRLEGDAMGAVARLKEGDGSDLLTQGSAMLVRSLLAAGLVDELFLSVFPVLLGTGKRWFGEDAKPGEWAMVDSLTSATGVVISRYRPKGPVRTGSFVQGDPSAAEVERRAKMKAEEEVA